MHDVKYNYLQQIDTDPVELLGSDVKYGESWDDLVNGNDLMAVNAGLQEELARNQALNR